MCKTAADCGNTTPFKDCYEENYYRNETNFCECARDYGWIGENCDEPGPTLYFMRIFTFMFLLWTTFNVLTFCNSLFLLIQHERKNRTKILNMNPIFYVMCHGVLAQTCFVVGEVLSLITAFNSDTVILNGSSLGTRNGGYYVIAITLGVFFQACACLVIVNSWLDVLRSVQKVFNTSFFMSELRLKRIFMRSSVVIVSVILTSILLNLVFVAIAMFLVGWLLIAVSYFVAYVKFRNTLRRFHMASESSKGQKKALKLVKTSFLVTTVCFFGIFFTTIMLIYGTFVSKKITRIEGFDYFIINAYVTLAFLYLNLSYTSYYSHEITANLMKNQPKSSWVPWCGCMKRVHVLSRRMTLSKVEASGW